MTASREFSKFEVGDLIEMDGPGGRFGIAGAGGKPEAGDAFLYQDRKHRFFFYGKGVPLPEPERAYDVVLTNATVSRFEGPRPRISKEDLELIKQNIQLFFSRRSFWGVKNEIKPDEYQLRRVQFNWGMT